MKKILLATFAFALLFASCSKEENLDTQNGTGVLVVKLPAGSEARSVETVATTTGYNLNNVIVFTLINDAVVEHYEFVGAELTNKSKRIEQVPSAVNKVLVVANVPIINLPDVKSLTSATAIKAFSYTVASQNINILDVTRAGEGTPQDGTDPNPAHDPTHLYYKEVEVDLLPLTARFEIGTVTPGIGVQNVQLVGVWINNYYTNGSKSVVKLHNESDAVWNTSPSTATSPSTSVFGTVSMASSPYNYTEASYYDPASPLVTLDPLSASTKAYAYQVFADNSSSASGNVPHLILLVKGEYKDSYYDAGKKYFLRYLTFRKFLDGGVPINFAVTNTIYQVGVGATGIVVNAKDMTERPETDPFDLGISVKVTPWTPKTVTPAL